MANKRHKVCRSNHLELFTMIIIMIDFEYNNFSSFFVIFSPMNYNIDIVIELLNITLKQALQYHPQHFPWLRIEGDLEFREHFSRFFFSTQ